MRLYIVVDGSLPPGLQIAQAIHAKDEFTRAFPDVERKWAESSNTLAVLAARDRSHLCEIVGICIDLSITHARFDEPDLNNTTTAVAIEPGALSSKIVRGLRPALS